MLAIVRQPAPDRLDFVSESGGEYIRAAAVEHATAIADGTG
jgi:hypothetical protein